MATLPTYRSKRFGKQMRQLREKAGLSLKDASERLLVDQGSISRVENGKRGIQKVVLRAALDTYGVTDDRQRELLFKLAGSIRQRDWWAAQGPLSDDVLEEYLTLESDCRISRANELTVLPGLLQTEAYAKHLFRLFRPRTPPESIDNLVDIRMKRKERLDDPDFTLQAVIDANTVHRIGGGPELKVDQLRYLLEVGDRPNVTVQILPHDIDWVPDQCGSFNIFTLDPDWPGDIVWVESLPGGSVLEQPNELALYRRAWDQLTAMAMSPLDTERYIRELLEKAQNR